MTKENEQNNAAAAAPQPGPGAAAPNAAPAPTGLNMPPLRAACYFVTSAVMALAQGFGQNMISVNSQQLQGVFATTQAETLWLTAAYMAPNVSLTLVLIKLRGQFGLRRFAEISILAFMAANLLYFTADNFSATIAVRFLSGMAAASMTSLAVLYMLEPLPPQRKSTVGLAAAMTLIFMGPTVTRLVSPHLIEIGLWHGLTTLELSLAAIGLGLIYLFPLRSATHPMKIEVLDLISFLFIATGLGCFAVVATTGATYWWTEQTWIGWLLAIGIGSIAVAASIELNRERPFLDIRWLASPAVLHFAAAILLFRLVLSEQTAGAAGLLKALGLLNHQAQTLWLIVLAMTITGGAICALLMKPEREHRFHAVALVLLIAGSLMDTRSTSSTIPSDLYLSQAMIGLASALFLPPAMVAGLRSALSKGPEYILTFIIVFISTQKVGGMIGSAVFQTIEKVRAQVHIQHLKEALLSTDPGVTSRLNTYSSSLEPFLNDSTQLTAQASAQLSSQVSTQATIMAYNDTFMLIAMVSTGALAMLIAHVSFRHWHARLTRAAT